MAKLKKTLQVRPTNRPWMAELHFPYHPRVIEHIKKYPGRTWVPDKKIWEFPTELVERVIEFVQKMGWDVNQAVATYPCPNLTLITKGLKDFQEHAAHMALLEPSNRWILGDDTGLGKTIEAIAILRQLHVKRALIVVPAIVRSKWEEELDQWWPDHPEVGRITCGSERGGLSKAERERIDAAYKAPFKIISYNLLFYMEKEKFDGIIFDEAHKLKNPTVDWAQRARQLVLSQPSACVLGLTATPAAEKPLDACGVVEVVWPGRMGGVDPIYGLRKACKERYANKEESEYGCKYYGANPVHIEELNTRLKVMMSRTTKLDVADLLPAFDVSYELIDGTPVATSVEEHIKHGWVKQGIELANNDKVAHASKWGVPELEKHTHIAILTDRRESARRIANDLMEREAPNVVCITGAQTPEKRNELLAAAAKNPSGVVVATMHSIGIGINLTFCTSALVAELCYRPEVLVQALGRFSRLSGTVPSSVKILAVKGTVDEVIANKVRDKILAINQAVGAGLSESELATKLGLTGTFDDMLADLIDNDTEEDEYDDAA